MNRNSSVAKKVDFFKKQVKDLSRHYSKKKDIQVDSKSMG